MPLLVVTRISTFSILFIRRTFFSVHCDVLIVLKFKFPSFSFFVDMDTIDVSNLNRQFLFRREHVGRSKAEVAAEAVHQLCPSNYFFFHFELSFKVRHFSTKFSIQFFQQFSLVMNALDNRECATQQKFRSSKVDPQVKPIVRDLTACYECDPRPEQEKTYPGCTIRNTPSEHIHCTSAYCACIHTFCLSQLFGVLDVDAEISPDFTDKGVGAVVISNVDGVGVGPMEEGQEESKTNGVASSNDKSMTFEKQMSTREWAETVKYDPEKIFDKLFHTDISYLLRLKGLWCERRPPVPIRKADIVTACASSSTSNVSTSTFDDMNKVWSLAECAEIFCECVVALSRRKNDENTVLHWDKDDEVAMRFVAASANIRASIFGIPCKSLFEIKCKFCFLICHSGLKVIHRAYSFIFSCLNSLRLVFSLSFFMNEVYLSAMAGNIVPAIATTNAIVAGMVVVEAAKIIAGNFDKLRCVFTVSAPNARGKSVTVKCQSFFFTISKPHANHFSYLLLILPQILVDHPPFPSKPSCFVCSDKRECFVRVNLEQMTVKALQDKILKGALNMVEPDVIDVTTSRVIISSDEDETSDIESKTLSELSLRNGSVLLCDDFRQQLEFKFILSECKLKEDTEEETRKRKSDAAAHLQDGETAAKRVKL
ncbi:unnamed protein product [Angiostrongylus costaricensis]|uniref:SUMO-activating enzyme subunit n=1 Tax=Angiostrongylus costaricensis TaxID=334426 RepID=A0A158PHB7_ANGCS|nr:unnamed protein product [Angiostrongylus costaricensis]